MDSDREKQIGKRLRKFREALQIPRSKFAVTIGIGTERLASYEAGRARLRFGVFKAVYEKYRILPLWLATERGGARLLEDRELSVFPQIPDQMLFSEAFDKHLAANAEKEFNESAKAIAEFKELIREWHQVIRHPKLPEATREELLRSPNTQALADEIGKALQRATSDMRLAEQIRRLSTSRAEADEGKNELTNKAQRLSSAGVPAKLLPNLLTRLRKATAERGMKVELAEWMKVHPQSITDWLTERKEPSGETTLQLLYWVEQQERQQTKSPGNAATSPGPKAQSTRSKHEKVKSGPRKP